MIAPKARLQEVRLIVENKDLHGWASVTFDRSPSSVPVLLFPNGVALSWFRTSRPLLFRIRQDSGLMSIAILDVLVPPGAFKTRRF